MELKLDLFKQSTPLFSSGKNWLTASLASLLFLFSATTTTTVLAAPSPGFSKNRSVEPVAPGSKISISQVVQTCFNSNNGKAGNLTVRFRVYVQNTGTMALNNIQVENYPAITMFPFFEEVIAGSTNIIAGAGPAINGGFDGDTDPNMFIAGGALAPGALFVFEYDVEYNPNAMLLITPFSQLLATASGGAIDESDVGDDPTSENPLFFGDAFGNLLDLNGAGGDDDDNDLDEFPVGTLAYYDDPTPVPMPRVNLTKEVIGSMPAASGVVGNRDVEFHLIIENTGNLPMDRLDLEDDLVGQLGAGFVQIISLDINEPASTAIFNPTLNNGYDGGVLSIDLFNQTSGYLRPGEIVDLTLIVEINPDGAAPVCLNMNQAYVKTRPGYETTPFLLTELIMPDGSVKISDDLSDDGNLPEDNNDGFPGATPDNEDDPTLIQLPQIRVTKAVTNCTPIVDPTGCTKNFDVTFTYVIENVGNLPLDDVEFFDDLNAASNLGGGGGFVSVTGVNVVGSSMSNFPAYDGTSGVVSAIDANGASLNCGEQIVVEITLIANSNLVFTPTTNQGRAEGDFTLSNGGGGGTVSDLTDSGTDPESYNNTAPGATPDNEDDPTPLYLPRINVAKEVLSFTPAASGVIGNYDVTFHVNVYNSGNVDLDRLQVFDANIPGPGMVALILAPAETGAQSANISPVLSPGFFADGLVYDGTSGLLAPDEELDFTFVVEMDADAFCFPGNTNQVTASGRGIDADGVAILDPVTGLEKIMSDLSDGGSNALTNNAGAEGDTGDCDDPTPVEIPEIRVTKRVIQCTPVDPTASFGCTKEFDVTFEYVVENTGTFDLTDVQLFDDLSSGGNLGGAFVSFTGATTTVGAIDGAYAGNNAASILMGTTLTCGQQTVVTVSAVFDSDLAPVPSTNQAMAEGTFTHSDGTATTGTVDDLSDSGTDPESFNDTAPGATPDNEDDPTPVYLPRINISKEVTNFQQAASGVIGNYDVTFHVNVYNSGNTDLDRLQIQDLQIPGGNMIALIQPPSATGGQSSNIDPVFSASFFADGFVYDGTSGLLKADETLDFTFIVEMDADAMCLPLNQMLASGRGVDENGNVILDPITGLEKVMTDLSDSGSDPLGNNAAAPSSALGCDDPTPIEIPEIRLTKTVIACSQVVDPTFCTKNYEVTYKYTIENTGSIDLTNIQLFDEFSAATNFGIAYQNLVSVNITLDGAATGTATNNPPFDGTDGVTSVITTAGPLACGEQICIEITVIIDSDLSPAPATNQARTSADWTFTDTPATTGTVEDLSDSGTIPESPNDAAPGASTGGQDIDRQDDPTPTYLPRINVAKEVVGFAQAASGVIGNFDVTFHINVVNSGNVDLDRLQIDELTFIPGLNMVAVVQEPTTTGLQNATIAPIYGQDFFLNSLFYDGTSGLLKPDEMLDFEFTMEMNADAICIPLNQVLACGRGIDANGDPVLDPVSGMEKIVCDLSDSGPDPLGDNFNEPSSTAGCNDPTPIEIPEIHLTKTVVQCDQVFDPTFCTKNYEVTFKYTIENTGSIDLNNLTLFDEFSAATNFDIAYQNLVAVNITLDGAATGTAVNGAFDGFDGVTSAITTGGPLACGEQICIEITVIIDSDLSPAPATNQASTTGDWAFTDTPATTGTVDDLSDSGTIPESPNDAAQGASTGGQDFEREDDPTPTYLPRINAAKEVLGFVPASSGTIGNFDVTFHVNVVNSGNVDLDNLQVRDINLFALLNINYVSVVQMPTVTAAQTATIAPVFGQDFFVNAFIYDGTSGLLKADEQLDFIFTLEMDADAICIPTNQVRVWGRGLDLMGNPVVDPITGMIKVVTDLSDSGPDPLGDNFNEPSSQPGCNDATPIEIPDIKITKSVQSIVPMPGADGCSNNFEIVFRYVIENTGSIPLTDIMLKDKMNNLPNMTPNLGSGFVQVTDVDVVFSPFGTNATPNPAFDGTDATVSAITTTGPLFCHFQIIATITVIANAERTPVPPTNQANAMASWAFTDTPPTTGMITDLSDSGTVPESPNDLAAGASSGGQDIDRHDDPTPFYLPRIRASKEVVNFQRAASGVIGNFDVTYHVRVQNAGNVPLDNLQIQDLNIPGANMVAVVQIPTTTAAQTAQVAPVYGQDFFVNGLFYDGTSGILGLGPDEFLDFTFTMEMNADAICIPTNQVLVSGRFVNPATGAVTIATDLSDSGSNPNLLNAAAPSSATTCNNPTPVELPEIRLTKEVIACTQVPDPTGCTKNYSVTFKYVIENTGSIDLNNIRLFDQFNAIGNFGTAFQNLVSVGNITGPAAANGGFTGTSPLISAINSTGPLACGQQIMVEITVIINSNLSPAPATNQARATGAWAFTNTPATTGTVEDLSDSGNDPESPNDSAQGASTGGLPEDRDDDPTPAYLPRINVAKEVVGFVNAASGTIGNFDVTFHVNVYNSGNVDLDRLQVDELNLPGVNMISLVTTPAATGLQTATISPVFNPGFFADGLVFDGTSGLLKADQVLDFTFTVEMNADAICIPTNQVTASGRGLDLMGNAVIDPVMLTEKIVSDLSDSGPDPLGNNAAEPSSAAGCNDPTPVELPDIQVTKEVQSITAQPLATGCSNNFLVVYRYIIENNGSIPLNTVTLKDEFDAVANLGLGFVSLQNVTVVSGPAVPNTPAYNGFNNTVSAITSTGPLPCSQQIIVTITVLANSDLVPLPPDNQAVAMANWAFTDTPPTTGMVSDASDSGNQPEDRNDAAAGATLGGLAEQHHDDPTPTYLPRIRAAKEVTNFVPAASGVIGNFDVTFRVRVENRGNVPLDNLQIDELNIPGVNMIAVVQEPTTNAPQNADVFPVYGQDFFINGNIYDGTSGILLPDQRLDFSFTMEMDADAICIPTNQVLASGRFVNAATSAITVASDLSDSGPNPNLPNVNSASSTFGCDDPTPIEIPDIKISKEVQSVTMVADPTGCTNNFSVVFKYNIENTGSIPLSMVTLKDQFDAATNLGAGFVSVSNVTVVSGPATAVGGFTGTSATQSAITATGPLACNSQIMVTITVIVNGDLTPVPPVNQAVAMANWTFTNQPPTTGMVSDNSDSGSNPENRNDAAAGATLGGLDIDHHDDPTPVYLPRIRASKEVTSFVPAASGVIGNFDVTFRVRVQNNGNVPLDELQIDELNIPGANMVAVVQMPTTNASQNATVFPVYGQNFFLNGNIYDGTSGILEPDQFLDYSFTMEMDADAICIPTNQVNVSGRFVNPATGAITVATDLSDSGSNPNSPNAAAPSSATGCNDATPIEIPDIKISKEVQSVTMVADPTGCTNNFTVVYKYTIENTGSIPLTNVGLKDWFQDATNLGAGHVSVTNVTVLSGPAVPMLPFTGSSQFASAIASTGPLACNQQIMVTITAIVNGDLTPVPATNQATAMATWTLTNTPATTGMISDLSDSGSNPENRNDAAPGATLGGLAINHQDDPTPVYLPRIRASKEVTSFVPAASGVIGNFDVTFRVRVQNNGNVSLDELQIDELNIPGANMVAVVQEPTTNGPQSATVFPVYGQDFFLNGNIYDGTSGLLEPDQLLDYSFTMEMDADAICIPTNQVNVSGRFVNPATGAITVATDLSDSGSNPNSPNAGAPSSAAGCNDATPIEIQDIKISKEVQSVTMVADPTGCSNNFSVVFKYTIENTGSIPLTLVQLKDHFSAAGNLGAGFVSISNVTVLSGPANVLAGFTGTSAAQSAIVSTGPLACNSQIMVTITAIVNGDLTPVPPVNQAVAMASWTYTNAPATTGMVSDLSDSGTNPENRNDAAAGATLGGLAIQHQDDPTPVYLPRIRASKEVTSFVPAASGAIGNFDVTFRVRVQNNGNVPLDHLQVDELNIPGANMVAVVQEPTTMGGQNAAVFPVYGQDFFLNGNIYDGTSGILNPDQLLDYSFTMEMDADAICIPTNQVNVSGRFVNPATGAVTVATDLSDSGSDPNSPNSAAPSSAAGCNDPTPIEIQDIKISKEVQSVTMVADPTGCTNNFSVVFKYTIENTGSIPLTLVQLKDQFNAAGNLGAGFVSISNVTVLSGPASVLAGFTGTSAVQSAINSTGPLACNSQIMVTITAIINGDLTPAPPTNQATAMATWTYTNTPATTGMVSDLSDSGSNPENRNDAAPGGTLGGLDIQHQDDPTPVYLPRIRASKEVVGFAPAASGLIGNFDVTFRVRVQNNGNVPLDNLQIDELNIPGANMVAVVQIPTTEASQNASVFPVYGQDFFINGNIYDGTSGLLLPDQLLDYSFTMEMDADAICIPTNQVNATGRFVNPATGAITIASDLSDSGSNPNSPNAAAPSSAAGCNDATPIEIPDIKISKEVQSVTLVADPTNCTNNFSVVFKYTIENTGSIPLTAVQLKDHFSAATNMGAGFVSISNVNVISGPATANGGFTGTSAVQSAINSTGPLACNSQIMVTITAIINGDLTAVPPTNQASAMANWSFTNTPATTGMISDVSDSGSNPENRNDAAAGATLGGLDIDHHNDPTPVYLPRIRASKEVTSFAPATSGVIGNFDVTFRVRVLNAGNVPLDRLQVDELNIPGINMISVVQIPTTNAAQNATVFPVYGQDFFLNGNIYDGTSGLLAPDQLLDFSFTIEMDANAICLPTNQVVASGRFLNTATGVATIATDLSDSGSNPNSSNAGAAGSAAGCDDPTPIELPEVRLTKQVTDCSQVADPTGCSKNYTVTFKYTIENTGSIPLSGLQLLDQLNAAANLGGGFVSFTSATVLMGPAVINATYNGTQANVSIINVTGPLACGQQIMVQVVAVFNSDLTPAPAFNQASTTANWTLTNNPPTTGVVTDLSDSGPDPESYNNDSPGATPDNEDDPTPVYLPRINASKEITSIVAATSGTIGNFDVTFRVRAVNTGNTDLDRIQLDELNIPGINMISVVQIPTTMPTQNATVFPVYGQDFFLNGNIYDGTSGLLKPDQLLDFWFTVEMDADGICQPANQILASARGIDPDGLPIVNPSNGMVKIVFDKTDGGSDPRTANTGVHGNTGGCDDPTTVEIPEIHITKQVLAAVMVTDPSFCSNNYLVTLKYTIENTGSIPLTNVQLLDQLNAATNFGAGFVNVVSTTVNMGPATANAGFTGQSATQSAINSTGPLACNQQIMVTIVATVNADLTPAPATNQATARATFTMTNAPATTGQVTDLSDSGPNPEGPNDDAPGASAGGDDIDREDDPTPVYLPKIRLSKEVIAFGPASSGALGNMDMTIHFQILNAGNTPLTNICLTDNLAAQLGLGAVVKVYSYDLTQLTTASDWPVLKNDFTGGVNGITNLFDCTSGLLMPDEVIDVTVEFEINPNPIGAILPPLNHATAAADATDFDLNELNLVVTDLSDGGADPNDSNAGYPGNTGGCNDKTPISLPQLMVAKEVISCVPKGPFDPGDFLVTFKIRIQNTGNVRLQGITATDNLAAQIGAAFIAVTTPPSVSTVNGGAILPVANAAFNGFANSNLLLANNSQLNPGGVITITWTAEINPNALLPQDSLTNQVLSTAVGLHPNVPGGLVSNQVVIDPVTGLPYPVTDLSDSGSTPEAYNAGEPGDHTNPGAPLLGLNDPTPIEIPSINVSKKVVAIVPSGIDKPGEFDVTFLVKVANTGNVNLADFTLDDNIVAGLGAAYLGLLEAPHYVAPYLLWDWPGVFNPLFNGASDIHIFNNEYNLLIPGETYSLEFKIRVNPNALLPNTYLWNQMTAAGRGVRKNGTQVWTPIDGPVNGPAKWSTDISDDGTVPESLNPGERGDNIPVAGTHDNPTPLEIPSVNLAKYVVSVVKVPGEVPPGNARLTFEIKLENTGNVQLRNLMMEDAVVTQMGTAWLAFAPGGKPVISASTATLNPTLNAAFTGLTGPNAMIFNGTTGRLDPGQTITVRLVVDLDPNKSGMPKPLKNQANGKGAGFNWLNPANAGPTFVPVPDPNLGNAGPMLTFDLSDSGPVPESNNIGQPCDMGTHNDATPFEIPFILASKQEVPDLWGSTCAKSGTNGNLDITFQIKLVNVGNTDLDHISLLDNLQQQFGSAFVKVLNGGISIDSSTATMNPSIDWSYNGNSQPLIFNGSDGLLKPNERIVVRITAEINPNAPGAPKPYDNQGTAFGRAKRADGTLIFVPLTTSQWIVDDRTDGGDNPETVNLGWPGDTGGSNDPFDFRLPMTMKFPTNLVIHPTCSASVEDQLLPWINSNAGGIVVAAPGCGPITWSSNYPGGGLDWLVADIYGCGCSGTWTIQFKATDECGHDVCFNVKVIIEDTAPPCWDMLPMSKTFYCGSGGDTDVQKWLDEVGGAWFFDPCALNIDSWNNYNPATANACDNDGTVVTFFIRDECGNVNTATATLKVVDNEPPTFTTVPANISINCNATIPAPGNVVAKDDCSAVPTITMTTSQGVGDCAGAIVYTRTWTATDLCGNTSTATQTVTKKDISKPFFTSVPANLTITCPDVPVFGNVVANDLCAGAAGVTVTFVDKIIFGTSCPAGYTIRRTWTATDLCGNTRSIARVIEVEPDPNPPFVSTIVLVAPLSQTIPCSSLPIFDNVTATSDCPTGSVSIAVMNTSTPATCTTPGVYVRTWTATDGCNSTKTVSQTITQMPDTQPPVIIGLPADVTVSCGNAPAFGVPTVSDNCTGQPTLDAVTGSNNSNCLAGQTAIKWRTWTATDGCGNAATVKQTITELPLVTTMSLLTVPPSFEVTCGTPLVFGTPTVSTTCPIGSIALVVSDSVFGGGCDDAFHTRYWWYEDGCGNKLSTSQTILVLADIVPPVFTNVPNGPIFVDCNTLIPTAFATADDDCSGAATVVYSVEVLGMNPCDPMSGNACIVTWVAVDACGNVEIDTTEGFTTGNASGIVFVSAPQSPHNYTCGEIMVWDTPVCATPCAGGYTLAYSEISGGNCATGRFVTRTWTAKDVCGSQVSCSHTQYFAPDAQPPVITFVSNVEIIECGEPIPNFTPGVSDNCAVQSLEPVSDIFIGDTLVRTWMATDECGNTSTALQYFIYQDTEAPVFVSIPNNQTVQCGQPINFGSPSVIDDCGNPTTISWTDATIAGICAGNYTIIRTWMVMDDHGNTATALTTVSVKDNTDPTFANVPLDNLLSCDDALDIPQPTVNDCSGVTLTFADNLVQGACTGDYVITRTWTATDGCGNVAIADAKFTLIDDIAPTFDPLSTTNLTMTFAEFENLNLVVGATDNCGIVNITDPQTTAVIENCQVVYQMNWTATDDCGNFAQQVVEITISDETPLITADAVPTTLQTGQTFVFNSYLDGGVKPFGYAWTITGGGWFIAGGENTPNPTIVVGIGTASLTLTVTNGLGCTTSQTWILTAEVVGIEDLDTDSFELFPVPTVENVSAKFTLRAALELEFRITDDAGRLIETRQTACPAGANNQQFDLTKYAAGAYLLEIRGANGASLVKPFVRL